MLILRVETETWNYGLSRLRYRIHGLSVIRMKSLTEATRPHADGEARHRTAIQDATVGGSGGSVMAHWTMLDMISCLIGLPSYIAQIDSQLVPV